MAPGPDSRSCFDLGWPAVVISMKTAFSLIDPSQISPRPSSRRGVDMWKRIMAFVASIFRYARVSSNLLRLQPSHYSSNRQNAPFFKSICIVFGANLTAPRARRHQYPVIIYREFEVSTHPGTATRWREKSPGRRETRNNSIAVGSWRMFVWRDLNFRLFYVQWYVSERIE